VNLVGLARSMQRGVVASKALSAALMDVYLGKEPPSATMKEDFLCTVAEALKK
jgi:hypothetical protein